MSAGPQSLALAEKRAAPPRSGSCAGIFFHLFRRNRRLTNNKLFPPGVSSYAHTQFSLSLSLSLSNFPSCFAVRAAKWVSKKLGGNKNTPNSNKLLLIAEENQGGFPNTSTQPSAASGCPSEQGSTMRPPGLVARLMGLESMPAVSEKPRKALGSEDGGPECSRLDQDLCLRAEPRPRKLRKTGGFLEKRFGSDALSKGLMPHSRRKGYGKFISPVKGSTAAPRRSSARLIDVAARILEPGLQSRNRAKCALTYVQVSDPTLALKGSEECPEDVFVGSCKSCGGVIRVGELRIGAKESLVTDYQSTVLDLGNAPPTHNNGFEESKMRFGAKESLLTGYPSAVMDSSNAPTHSNGFEETKMRPQIVTQSHDRVVSLASQAKMNVQSKPCDSSLKKFGVENERVRLKPRQNVAANSSPKLNTLRHGQQRMAKDKLVAASNVYSHKESGKEGNEFRKAKDSVSMNKTLNSCTRSPTTSRGNQHRLEIERNGCEKNMARKKRPISSPHIDHVVAVNSNFSKQKNGQIDSRNQRRAGYSCSRSAGENYVKTGARKKAEGGSAKSSTGNIIVCRSLMRQEPRSFLNEVLEENRRGQVELTHDASNFKRLVLDSKDRALASQGVALTGEALHDLLNQKIRELTSLDQEESAIGDAFHERSAAFILEELISDFTMGASVSQTNVDSCNGESSPTSKLPDVSHYVLDDELLTVNKKFHINDDQEQARADKSTAFPGFESDHLSPVSIFDASFSTDSTLSETLNVSPGYQPHFGLTESSCNQTSLENDLLDSATSLNITMSNIDRVPRLIHENFSKHNIHFLETLGCKFNDNRAITNAEPLLENISSNESDKIIESSTDLFPPDMLETTIKFFLSSSKNCFDFKGAKEGNQLRRLLFDCIIECFDSKYSLLCKSGYKSWLKLNFLFSKSWLTRVLHEEIRGWGDLAGMDLDELIEKEMRYSTIGWKDFEIEVFESSREIEDDVLQFLVNETVIDLCRC